MKGIQRERIYRGVSDRINGGIRRPRHLGADERGSELQKFDRNLYDVASQIALRFSEIHTEWTEHGRALEADEKPPVRLR
jgi:hypothetical protein